MSDTENHTSPEVEQPGKTPKKKRVSWLSAVFVTLISLIICIPVFIIIYRYIPAMHIGRMRVDHIVTFVPILALIIYIVVKFKMLIYILGSGAMVWLTIMSITGEYTMRNLYYDYSSMLYALRDGAVPIEFLEENEEFTNEDRIRAAIDYKEVRPYAVTLATKNFRDYYDLAPGRTVIQTFSLFKEIYPRWVYVHDPKFEDYFAKASETMEFLSSGDGTFAGDCDDYSIFMAACVKAIGGEVRLVRTRIIKEDGTKVGHIYPEVKIGDQKDLESATYMIKEVLFKRWAEGKDIMYHVDDDGMVWLNFDYNDPFPGGRYQSNIRISEIEI